MKEVAILPLVVCIRAVNVYTCLSPRFVGKYGMVYIDSFRVMACVYLCKEILALWRASSSGLLVFAIDIERARKGRE